MPPLTSLENDYPIIDSSFRRFCSCHGIFTVEDFLLSDIYVLVAFAERESSSERLKQGITQILSIIDTLHQPWTNGVDMLRDMNRNKHVLSTGCEGIDLLLGGGLHEGQVTELVGPSSSGKTQVCLQAATTIAYKYMASVMFLDTCNSFSARRIALFMDRLLNPSETQEKHKSLERIMRNIFCHSVFDIFGLLEVLHDVELKMTAQGKSGEPKLRLLIIDSMSSLITPILGGGGAQGHALMVSAGFLLKKLVYEYDLSVLVTNHMVSGEGASLKPALGESWKNASHVQLLLSRGFWSSSQVYNLGVIAFAGWNIFREISRQGIFPSIPFGFQEHL